MALPRAESKEHSDMTRLPRSRLADLEGDAVADAPAVDVGPPDTVRDAREVRDQFTDRAALLTAAVPEHLFYHNYLDFSY